MFAHGRWFSPGTSAFSTTKTGSHDIAEILLKVTLNPINQIKSSKSYMWHNIIFFLLYSDNMPWHQLYITIIQNLMGGVMVSVLAPSTVDHGFKHRSGQAKDNKNSTQYYGERAKTDWHGIRIMCPNGAQFYSRTVVSLNLAL